MYRYEDSWNRLEATTISVYDIQSFISYSLIVREMVYCIIWLISAFAYSGRCNGSM